jgi:hypothetical protein
MVAGNRMTRLEDGARFYPEMLAAISGARRSIALEWVSTDRAVQDGRGDGREELAILCAISSLVPGAPRMRLT